MLTMVIVNPMHVANVKAVPRVSEGALAAISAENCGESAHTEIPQTKRKAKNINMPAFQNSGDARQQIPEMKSAALATVLLPAESDIFPPNQQPGPPIAMIMNESSGMECC